MIRKIIKIDEEKCNGCGACASACHEGAIDMVDGKAKLMRENFEKLYYPLTINDKENNTCPWQWVKSPWPWENNENGGMK